MNTLNPSHDRDMAAMGLPSKSAAWFWSADPRPSIFATDPRFTGEWASKANHCNDLTPKPSKFSVAIATPAESARTNSIKRAK